MEISKIFMFLIFLTTNLFLRELRRLCLAKPKEWPLLVPEWCIAILNVPALFGCDRPKEEIRISPDKKKYSDGEESSAC